ncbi:ralA-binding protein 1 [Chelonus insularis]|uniref:ralA-binding protein 1 n=1 Tax=Chelonus insularis TaxID=460826 RepID=UPI00158A6A7B|nr:ralA-binding protein 1 [Chelonus insularis]
MDFESPDVEKEFPGLYASESARKSNESDFSDEGVHDKHSKKELLGGKKKDKKDRKDRGYATLEGESSPDEDQETKSPSKSKKTKTFKFPSKKREKSREKDGKDKETDKDKEKKKRDKDEKHKDDKEDKDKRKEKDRDKDKDKIKIKLKEKKKGKHVEEGIDIGEAQPIFGVSLHLAVERSRCHDGVELPLVVRNCIDYLEEFGMTTEGLYKVPGVKSKVQHLKKLYNQRETVNIFEFDPTIATSLLVLFFKELPEPVLDSSEMVSKFEQAASTKDVAQREYQLSQLVLQLPECNQTLLAWVTLHLDHVTSREKTTKMNAQAIAMTLSPVLQMSHRLLLALLCHCKALFPELKLTKYIPPLPSGSTNLPDDVDSIARELAKQESLLSQIHMQMNDGFVTKAREEQLWEVQRLITQLKRKYKTVQKLEGQAQKSLDEEVKGNDENQVIDQSRRLSGSIAKSDNVKNIEEMKVKPEKHDLHIDGSDKKSFTTGKDNVDGLDISSEIKAEESENKPLEKEDSMERLRESLIYEELINMEALLRTRIMQEKNEIKRLNDLIFEKGSETLRPKETRIYSPNEAEITAMIQLAKENQLLEKKMMTLIKSIIEEKDACVELRVQLAIHQLMAQKNV